MTLLGEARASLDEQRELAERMARRARARRRVRHVDATSPACRSCTGARGELLDEGVVARLAALERVRDALARLAELGPVSELVDQAPRARRRGAPASTASC